MSSTSLSGLGSSTGTSAATSGSSSLPTLGSSSAVGAINFTGIASGLNTNAIIQELLQADQIPITDLQNQQTAIQAQLSAVQTYATNLQAVQTAAQALNAAGAFNPVTSTSSNTSAATITTTTGAAVGNYDLSITQLAQAEKISSAAQTDATSALNLTGTLVIDGQGVNVGASDTLTTIAQKINQLGAGVTASIINGGTGSTYLTLSSNSTGASNKIQIADLQGNVAQSLGLIGGTATVRDSTGGDATGYAFSSQTDNLAAQFSATGLSSDTFAINGVNVTVDPNSTTLQGLASAINAAGTGATASIVSSTSSTGSAQYQLKISGATTITDSGSLLQGVGILQQGYSSEILQGQDAQFTLDNIQLTSSSNTVTSVIPGATLQLLEGTKATPGTTTLSLSENTSQVTTTVQNFVTAYNNLVGYVSQESQLNTSNYATGPLFGDATVSQIQGQLASQLFTPVPGLQPPYNNLAAIGLGFDQTGNLTFDSSQLTNALAANPTAVQNLFLAQGSGSTQQLNYISSTSATVPSGSGNYAVNITQAASEGTYTASTAQTAPLAQSELLTFNGALFGNTNATLLLQQGETQQDIVNQINSDATLGPDVTASIQNGLLTITSKQYGTNGNFTVTSDTAASASSSGIQGGTYTTGVDVAGTIDGEAATGAGQYLTGNKGNTNTAGLQISYTGSATGAVGSISFNNGVAAELNNAITGFLDPTSGLVTNEENSFNSQISDINTQITALQQQMSAQQSQLQTEFSNMETALAQLQTEQKQLAAETGSTSSSSSSIA
jgi:flagellar hook-associated protein 2